MTSTVILLRQVAVGDGGRHLGDVANLRSEVRRHRVDRVGEILPRAGDAAHLRLAAEPSFGADFARDAGDFRSEGVELVDHRVDGVFELENLAAHVDGDLLGKIAVGDGGGDVGDVADLRREVRGHEVHRIGEVFPRAAHPLHLGLAAELPFGADFARDARHFRSEGVELVDHRVDGVFEFEDFAFDVDRDLLGEIALGDGGGDVGDVANLRGEVRGHEVHRVGEILPRAADAGDLRLAAQAPFGADFARDAGDFRSEGVELVDHRVDGAFELENFAADVDGNLLGEIALGDGRRHFGDVADLRGEVARHRVDRIGEIFPRAADAFDDGLAAELAFGADFARDARHLRGERVELIDHRVDRVLQLEDLAADGDGDLLGEVAVGDGGGDVGDVANLRGEVRGHEVYRIGEVFPRAADADYLRLAAELAFGTDFARDARHFEGEGVELIDHRVDGVLELEYFAAYVDRDFLRKVALGDGRRHFGDVADLRRQVRGHEVHRIGEILPRAADALHLCLAAELAFGADFARDARHFGGEGVELVDHRVDGALELEDFAAHVDRDLLREVALGDGRRHFGDIADLRREIAGHRVDRVGEIFPGAGDAFHRRLAAELAFGADFARDARHFGGERVELIDHRVDRVFELENFAFHVDGDLLGEIALGDGGGDLGDVADLVGEVAGHRVDRIGEIFPGAGDAFDDRLSAELTFGTDFAPDARHFRGEGVELIDHRVDGAFELEDLAARFDGDLLGEVAVGDGGGDVGDIADLVGKIAGHRVDGIGEIFPRTGDAFDDGLPAELAFGTDFARDAGDFGGEGVELIDHRVDQLAGA